MATTGLYITGTFTTLMSGEFSALVNAGTALGSAFNNSPASLGYYWGMFELFYATVSNPTTGNTMDLYLTPSPDGTNYGDTGNQVLAANNYVGSWVLASGTAQRLELWGITLPPTLFKPYVRNGGGVAMASGATVSSYVRLLPYSQQAA